jgi:hypothetical protein
MTSTLTDRRNGTSAAGVTVDTYTAAASRGAVKAPVRLATTAPIALAGLLSIDGVQTVENDRVLNKNSVDATANGIYVVKSGNWVRAPDFDDNADVRRGTQIFITDGTVNGGQLFTTVATNPVVIGTSSMTFTESNPGTDGTDGVDGVDGVNGTNGVDGKFSGAEVIETGASRTLGAADVGKTFIANRATAITFNLDPAATLGATWMTIVKNIGVGDLTIDPSGAETIDGAASLILTTNQSAVIASNGTIIRSHFVSGGGGMFRGNNGTVGARSGDIFRVNAQTLTADVTIGATENAAAAGPIAVNTGVTLTVASGGTLAIV